jgi:hypothetical protein
LCTAGQAAERCALGVYDQLTRKELSEYISSNGKEKSPTGRKYIQSTEKSLPEGKCLGG